MAKKDKAWLLLVGAIDTQPRPILASDKIEVRCSLCPSAGLVLANRLTQNLKNGYSWYCRACHKSNLSAKAKARGQSGENNPFYGKKHSNITKDKISKLAKDRTQAMSEGDRLGMTASARATSEAKYGGNAMNNQEVRAKHAASVSAPEYLAAKKEQGKAAAATPGFAEQMRAHSTANWRDNYAKMAESIGSTNKGLEKIAKQRVSIKAFHATADRSYYDALTAKIAATHMRNRGVTHPMHQKEYRDKILKGRKGNISTPEKIVMNILKNGNYDYLYQYDINGKFWDFAIFQDGVLQVLIETDGEYHHGLRSDSSSTLVAGHTDHTRFAKVPEGVKLIVVDGMRSKEIGPYLAEMLGIKYKEWVDGLFDEMNGTPFPYPKYSKKWMHDAWKSLQSLYFKNTYDDNRNVGTSIIKHYHESIFRSRTGRLMSPVEAWNNPVSLRACIENRFLYASRFSSKHIADGFNHNHLAKKVSVFQPAAARYLLHKYTPDAKTVVDPHSGFSGRMLGACSLGMSYTGYDIREEAIVEAGGIVEELSLPGVVLSCSAIEDLADSAQYDVLITCPPNSDKESWTPNQICQGADYYVEMALAKINAKTYIFVVDSTTKYQDFVVEQIKGKRGNDKATQLVLVINKERI